MPAHHPPCVRLVLIVTAAIDKRGKTAYNHKVIRSEWALGNAKACLRSGET